MPRGARAVPLVFALFVWSLTTHGKFSDSGDEPHYLMIAESLFSDHDLDLANNYANGDGRWFGAESLEAGPHARRAQNGALWSSHDIGLPVLVLPVYAIATRVAVLVPETLLDRFRQPRGLFAYSLVSLTLVALTACALALLIAGFSRHTSATQASLAVLTLGLSPPVLSHAFLVFPETPAFFVVAAAVWIWCLHPSEITTSRMLSVVAAIGVLPWLHRKFTFFAIALIVILVHRHRGWFRTTSWRAQTALLLLGLGPQAALHLWTLQAWGTVGGPQMVDTIPFSIAGTVRGGLGLLFDRERGLAGYGPVYLLLPLCWALASREHRSLLVPIALLFFPMASFAVWSAGFSPAARYLVPLMPLAVAPLPAALGRASIRRLAMPFLAFQAAIALVVWQFPRTLWPKEQGTNEALRRIPWIGPAYERLLPSIWTGDSPAGAWWLLVVVGLATVLIARRAGKSR